MWRNFPLWRINIIKSKIEQRHQQLNFSGAVLASACRGCCWHRSGSVCDLCSCCWWPLRGWPPPAAARWHWGSWRRSARLVEVSLPPGAVASVCTRLCRQASPQIRKWINLNFTLLYTKTPLFYISTGSFPALSLGVIFLGEAIKNAFFFLKLSIIFLYCNVRV